MGESIVILARHGVHTLCLRTHDLGGTDYEHILKIDLEKAIEISAGMPRCNFLHSGSPEAFVGTPRRLEIRKRVDRDPNTRAWGLYLGEDNVGFIDDESASAFSKHWGVPFEEGQPDWHTRAVEQIDDRIFNAKEELKNLEDQRERLLGGTVEEDLTAPRL